MRRHDSFSPLTGTFSHVAYLPSGCAPDICSTSGLLGSKIGLGNVPVLDLQMRGPCLIEVRGVSLALMSFLFHFPLFSDAVRRMRTVTFQNEEVPRFPGL